MNVVETFYSQKEKLSHTKLYKLEQFDIGYMLTDDIVLYLEFGIRRFPFLKMIASAFLDTTICTLERIEPRDIVVLNSAAYNNRLDYRNILKTLKKIFPEAKEWREISKITINKDFAKYIFLLVKWNKCLRISIPMRKERYFLLKRLLKCYKMFLKVKKRKYDLMKSACVICQFDGLDTENMISQYCKLLGIPTATLQHGHFHRTEYIDNKNYFISTPFEGFVSDYFLAWGNYTRMEATENGIDEKRILEVGSLKSNYKIWEKKCKFKVFGVILNGTLGYNENFRLIEYAEKIYKKYNMKYILRPHPTKKVRSEWVINTGFEGESDSTNETVREMAERIDFCLCGNSSVFTELIYMEIPAVVLRPKDSIDTYERVKALSFANEKELWDILDICLFNDNVCEELVLENKRLFFSTDNIEKSYRNAINYILGKTRGV